MATAVRAECHRVRGLSRSPCSLSIALTMSSTLPPSLTMRLKSLRYCWLVVMLSGRSGAPTDVHGRGDDQVFVNTHIYGVMANNAPFFHVRKIRRGAIGATNAPGKFLIAPAEHDKPKRARAYLLTDQTVEGCSLNGQ